MFTAAEVQGVIDAAFARLETVTPGVWAQVGEQMAQGVIDGSPVPAWIAAELNSLLAAKRG